MPIRRRQVLLLDLDGTLVDSAPGIIASARRVLAELGVADVGDADLRAMIGPPLEVSLLRLLGDEAKAALAARLYRERYAAVGIHQAEAFAGVPEALSARARDGTRLFICTSKRRAFAAQLVEQLGFAPLLSGVYGTEPDGRFEDKADLMAHILAAERLDPEEVCMVGDREHDVLAAGRNGVPAIGVLWGYGSRAELEAAGAGLIIERPDKLLE